MRASLAACLALLLASCTDPQKNRAHVPDQPTASDQTPIIVLGRPSAPPDQPNEPLQVAEENPPTSSPTPPPSSSSADLAALMRDPRTMRGTARPMRLLITELQSLEVLLSATPSSAPDRPKLVRRLAETYVEMKQSALRDKRNWLATNPASPQEIAKLDKTANAAHDMAIRYYGMLVNSHPGFCQSPHPTDPAKSRGCLDEVHYFMGLELLDSDKLADARKSFLLVIKDFPQSIWIPRAYLMFGEMFFAESSADPSKSQFAQQAYEKVLQYPPPSNEVYGFAHYRLGQVHAQQQDGPRALQHFAKTIEYALNFASVPGADRLGSAARHEIVPAYALAGAPSKAEAFFKHLANDPSGSNAEVATMLDDLVRVYLRDNKRIDASEVCRSVSSLLPACRAMVP